MARNRFDFEDMQVFRRALELVEAVDDFVRPLRGYRKALASQMFRSASSVAQNVAESTGRNGYRDRARFLDIANGSARETGAGVAIADRLDIGSAEDRRYLRELLTEIISMLTTNARLLRERGRERRQPPRDAAPSADRAADGAGPGPTEP
ncbi:MAG: four helix bundle protein [Candidatus Longimicrobiales bacterium M2_2A_002]